jgi:hypothetical protein
MPYKHRCQTHGWWTTPNYYGYHQCPRCPRDWFDRCWELLVVMLCLLGGLVGILKYFLR